MQRQVVSPSRKVKVTGQKRRWPSKGTSCYSPSLIFSLYFRLDLLLGRFCQLRRVRARCQYELSPRSVAWTVLSCTISVERRKLTLVCRFTNTIQSCVSFHLLVCLFTCDVELVKAALLLRLKWEIVTNLLVSQRPTCLSARKMCHTF